MDANQRRSKRWQRVVFTKISKVLAATNDDQARLSAKYFHVIGSPFLQLAKYDFIKVGCD